MKKKRIKGFTLVETIVVLVILAIVMAIAIPAFMGYIEKGKETACQANRRNLRLELIMKHLELDALTQEQLLSLIHIWSLRKKAGAGGRQTQNYAVLS